MTIKIKHIGLLLCTVMLLLLWQGGSHLAWSCCELNLEPRCEDSGITKIKVEEAFEFKSCYEINAFNSYQPVTFTEVPDLFFFNAGVQLDSFCVDLDNALPPNIYQVDLYSSINAPLCIINNTPFNFSTTQATWNKVNSILNNKQGNWYDVQLAIWRVIYNMTLEEILSKIGRPFPYGCQEPGIINKTAINTMVGDADGNFTPGPGQKIAVFFVVVNESCEPQPKQLSIIETSCCSGTIGDFVWKDEDGDGCQDVGELGIPDVTVNLKNPLDDTLIATTTTNADGFYLFTGLCAGDYKVVFETLDGFSKTEANVEACGDEKDSDCDGQPILVNLPDNSSQDLTIDCGYVAECVLEIDKKCLVVPAPPGPFVCSDAKPIDSLTMIWGGAADIRIRAWKGSVGSTLLADIDNIAFDDEVTVNGYAGSPNDVIWEIFDAGTNNKIGESTFHVSCSDDDMNGPEDCGMPEGDGKDNKAGYINTWIFEGMAGNGLALDCIPAELTPLDECEFEALPPPNCETLGKPTELTFRYTGADCSASQNSQAADKFECSNVPGPEPVSITILKDPNKITVSPVSGINVGDLVTVSAIGSDMASEVQLDVGGQFLKFHTSCSQPLAVGDVFGSLELVEFNGQGSGAEVTYFYEVTNSGNVDLDITSVLDDKLGELLETPEQLLSGESITLEKTAFISETTTNVVTAKANLFATDIPCGKAEDRVTVTKVEPTCDVVIVFDKLEDDKIKWKVTNTGKIVATLDTLTVNFPPEYGSIKEVKLDGAIFKKGDSTVYPNGVPPGATIGQTGWTNPDVTKRQLDPGEERTLEVVFTQKSKGGGWVDIDSAGTATFEESCALWLIKPSACEIGKPTALIFQYTGEDCVDGNDQASDKWSCSGDPSEAEPIQVVMTKDADKFDVSPSSIRIGESFEIRKTDGGDFPSEIKFDIRQDDVTLQSLKIHTSCSQPLSEGDQFGSVILEKFYPKP